MQVRRPRVLSPDLQQQAPRLRVFDQATQKYPVQNCSIQNVLEVGKVPVRILLRL